MRCLGFLRTAPALILPLGVLSIAGCGALTVPHPIIENRFRAELPPEKDEPPRVTVNVATGPVSDATTGISITQLSDRGQAALIEQTKGKPPAAIKPAATDEEAAVSLLDTVKRHMVVSVRSEGFLPPGDRVDAINVNLEILPGQPGGWSITSWTEASNGETTIDVGKATDVNSSKLTASTGAGFVSALPNANVGGEIAQSNTREANIKDTTVFDAAVDEQGHAWLDETAGWRVGLSHNLSMDATATAARSGLRPWSLVSFSSLTMDDPKHPGTTIPQPADQVRLNVNEVDVPDGVTQPICGRATLRYRIRHITNEAGRATFSESDDVVEPFEGTTSTTFLFAPAQIIPLYSIGIGYDFLSYKQAGSTAGGISFSDLSAATAFRDWLLQAGPTDGELANATIGIALPGFHDVRPLTIAERKSAVVYVSNQDKVDAGADASKGACRGAQLSQNIPLSRE